MRPDWIPAREVLCPCEPCVEVRRALYVTGQPVTGQYKCQRSRANTNPHPTNHTNQTRGHDA